MKYNLLLLAICSISFAFGQSNYRISNYSLVVKGTSNLHDWESNAKEVRANGNFTFTAGTLKSIDALYVEIPVKSIKSAKGSIMDNKTYDALKADKFPNIGFKLGKVNSIVKKGDGYDINASGSLSIAGASNNIDLYVKGKIGSDGTVTFSGSKKLKMTDYNIKPPTALLGTLTTGDEVEIVFQVSLKGPAPVSQ